MFNGARLVGPALAGLTVAAFGEGICFLINCLKLSGHHSGPARHEDHSRERRRPLRAGPLKGLRKGTAMPSVSCPIRYCIMLLALMNFIGMQYATLMPIFAKDVLHGGAHTLGFLASASGTGALLSALYLASRKSIVGLEKFASIALGLFGCTTWSSPFPGVCPSRSVTMLLSGVGMMTVLLACNTIMQTVVEEDKRGRVMSFHAMAAMGTVPFGSLIAGTLAAHLGAPHAVLISAGLCALGSLFFIRKVPAFRSAVREVYTARGIIGKAPAGTP